MLSDFPHSKRSGSRCVVNAGVLACQDSRYLVGVGCVFGLATAKLLRNPNDGALRIIEEAVAAAFVSSRVLRARISRALFISLSTPIRHSTIPSGFLRVHRATQSATTASDFLYSYTVCRRCALAL